MGPPRPQRWPNTGSPAPPTHSPWLRPAKSEAMRVPQRAAMAALTTPAAALAYDPSASPATSHVRIPKGMWDLQLRVDEQTLAAAPRPGVATPGAAVRPAAA